MTTHQHPELGRTRQATIEHWCGWYVRYEGDVEHCRRLGGHCESFDNEAQAQHAARLFAAGASVERATKAARGLS
jgi:hypothetical protein